MPKPQNFGKISSAIGLFSSCIKSGEEWTPHCEEASREAHEALSDLADEIDRLEKENFRLRGYVHMA